MIIGLTGGYASGKDAVADFFIKKGFERISLSDFIREELWNERKELTRNNLIKKGNELRKKFGNWVLGKMAVQRIDPSKDYVIVSIRNPGEVKELRKLPHFHLVNVTAPAEVRYQRLMSRGRENEKYTSLDDFIKSEKRELKNKDPDKQQLLAVFDMATIVLDNKYKTKKGLFSVLEKMHADLRKKEKKKKKKGVLFGLLHV
ncbi:MAG: hypothetical protein ACOC32_05045 [Nanoarchaeota archaeon]